MDFPDNLKYAKTHEWVKDLGNGVYEIGISSYAEKELGDLVYIALPQAGDDLKGNTVFADLESVKAVSDLISPLTGKVKEVNSDVLSSPELINKSPYDAWIIRAEGKIESDLLSSADYEKFIKE